MRVDRPQPLVGRAQVVRRDVLARVVVAVGRPGARVLRLRRRLRLRLLGRHELLRGGAALLGRLVLAADVQAHRDRDDDRDEPASHEQASSSHGPQDGKRRHGGGPPPGQERPDALCHLRQLEAERRLVQLAGPLRGAGRGSRCRRRGRTPRTPARPGRGPPRSSGAPTRGSRLVVSKTVKSPTKPDTPSNRPRLSSKTVSGAALVLTSFVRSPSASSRRRGARIAHDRALQRHGAPERFGAERRQPAAVRDVVAQPLQELVREPQLAAGERHPGSVAERRALVAREREVGGEVVRQPLAVEPAEQRRHLGVEALRQARRPRNGLSTRTELARTAAGRRSRRRRRPRGSGPAR